MQYYTRSIFKKKKKKKKKNLNKDFFCLSHVQFFCDDTLYQASYRTEVYVKVVKLG